MSITVKPTFPATPTPATAVHIGEHNSPTPAGTLDTGAHLVVTVRTPNRRRRSYGTHRERRPGHGGPSVADVAAKLHREHNAAAATTVIPEVVRT